MDDRRFDSLTRSLASGASRRSVLKGILGLGGAAVAAGTVLDQQADAARRPTPTPTPVKCPGRQTPVNGVCTCPGDAPFKCGPDCCTGESGDPPSPTHSECCDNACCQGTCFGEERCCPTNPRPGELPPTHILCDGPHGLVCVAGTCCDDSDCGDPCQVCNQNTHTCGPRCNTETEVCCTEQAGPGQCVTGECCLGIPSCELGEICCQGAGGTVCVAGETCPPNCNSEAPCEGCATCVDGFCQEGCDEGDICCDDECLSTSEFFACPAEESNCCAVADACCDVDGCCSGACYGGNSGRDFCCDGVTEVYCQPATGPAQCCPDPETDKCCGTVGCCTSSACNEEADVCCGEGSFACGTTEGNLCCGNATEKCCDGVCIDASECCPSTDGDCPAACEPNCLCGDGIVDPETDGLVCNDGGGVCACGWCVVPLDGCPCGCAGNPDCVRCDGNGECETYNQGLSCNGGAGICQDEWCVDAPPSCEPNCDCSIQDNDGLACNGGGGPVCGCGYCIIPLGDCQCGCDGNTDCVACEGGQCVAINQGDACNNGAGVCIDVYCDTCRPLFGECTVDGHCCSGLCDQNTCVPCKTTYSACDANSDCCSFFCSNGQCMDQ